MLCLSTMYTRQLCSLFLTIALSVFTASSLAQNKVVVVPLFDSAPTGVGAIPFYCPEVILFGEAPQQTNVSCFRSDTRAEVTPVPAGHLMLVTDIVVRSNSLTDPEFNRTGLVNYGRNSGGNFPDHPRQFFRVNLGKLNHLSLATPFVVLRGGESLGAINGDRSTKGRLSINASFSGYLIPATTFGQ